MARRNGRAAEVARLFGDLRIDRRDAVDLFSLFSGALAVQESLQLDALLRADPTAPRKGGEKSKETVNVAKIRAPAVKSHPWKKMLGKKKPALSPLAGKVPADCYFVEFRSLGKLLDVVSAGDLWGGQLLGQATRDARSRQVSQALTNQLVLEAASPRQANAFQLLAGIEEVAATGSDLLIAEGSDVTLLFRFKRAEAFKKRMDGPLNAAAKGRKDARRTEGEYLGVQYVHLTTPERDIHVFSAYPEDGLHVRSNSEVGLKRVLEAIKGKAPGGKAVRRLGETAEFAYIRTLMRRGAAEEDGFIYLSDPFIRHLVGPRFKLAAARRTRCYNHLRMIGHAATLYRTEFGKAPSSLGDLARADCCPGSFNKGELCCPDGGRYSLSADGNHGVCSHHGHAHRLVPCCECPLRHVSRAEADAYKAFRRNYDRYWRTFFDPIAVRVRVMPQRYRLETIVLPLIDNTIYTALARAFKGKPEPLDALPVPKRNIFSLAGRFDPELLKRSAAEAQKALRKMAFSLDIPARDAEAVDLVRLVSRGLGNQVGFHVYDAATVFDLDLTGFLGLLLGSFNFNQPATEPEQVAQPLREQLLLGFLVTSLNSPVYVSLPVRDEKVVDAFLVQLDKVLAQLGAREEDLGLGGVRLEHDFYKTRMKQGPLLRSYGFRLGPVKWRLHWARVGSALYVASKPFILDDLAAAHAAGAKLKKQDADPEATAHAVVRLRPRNWDRALPGYRLAWAENNRAACVRNLGPLANAGRAAIARPPVKGEKPAKPRADAEQLGRMALQLADRLYAVRFFCPEGGHYTLSADGKACSCSIHGTAAAPMQGLVPQGTVPGKSAPDFGNVTAALTFLDDGLHAVLVLERK
jgi:hypothetical protein